MSSYRDIAIFVSQIWAFLVNFKMAHLSDDFVNEDHFLPPHTDKNTPIKYILF